jgi:hypothetical protein
MFKFKKSVKIEYEPVVKLNSCNPFTVSKTLVPEWYKNEPLLVKETNKNILPLSHTIKGCTPFLDALTVGYTLVTLMDLGISQQLEGPVITWVVPPSTNFKVIETRPSDHLPKELIPKGFSKTNFVFWTNTTLRVPKGYAMLCTHPLNREDLPFRTLSAVIDGGFPMQNGKAPFFLREGFEGIIPKGTPFLQIIPFKLDVWKSELSSTLLQEAVENEQISRLYAKPRYKTKFWQKKMYS